MTRHPGVGRFDIKNPVRRVWTAPARASLPRDQSMAAARHNPLVFYVLLIATFVMSAGVIWFVVSSSAASVGLALVGGAIVFLTGRKVCQ